MQNMQLYFSAARLLLTMGSKMFCDSDCSNYLEVIKCTWPHCFCCKLWIWTTVKGSLLTCQSRELGL